MKIEKHVFALGLVAGLFGTSAASLGSQFAGANEVQVGYWLAARAAEDMDLDEDEASDLRKIGTAVGSSAGALSGMVAGAKIGSLGGLIGVAVGAGVGAL